MSNNHYACASLNHIPANLLTLDDYEQHAKTFIRPDIYAHISGGMGKEMTLTNNRTAFDRIGILPAALNSFANASTQTRLLQQTIPHPVLLAPTAYQTLVHPEGELASVRAADAFSLPMVSSTLSSHTLEAIANASPSPKWFQLYTQPKPAFTLELIKRAEDAGYEALVITVDAPVTGLRYRALRENFSLPEGVYAANLVTKPEADKKILAADASVILNGIMTDAPTWETLSKLREQTRLPVLLKGLINPADVLRAKNEGYAGVIVSNHGGRSLDGLPASIDMLPAIRQAVGADFPLLLDSGIRSGSDIFKALAAGANATLIGRPVYYALAIAGALGVAHMLRTLIEELELTMALAGCPDIASITAERIFPQTL